MLKVEMWLDKYYFLNVLTVLIKCNNIVDNSDPQKGTFGEMFFAKNVERSEINRKFVEIMRDINSMRKHGNNGQEIELAGTIIILRKVKNHKHNPYIKDKTTDTSYITDDRNKKEQKNALIFRKPYRKIVVIPNGANERVSFSREGLSIQDPRGYKAKPNNKKIVHLKPNILRDKYADACIKVAVRKCYKALITVNNIICKARYRCKSSFKSYFKNKSKVACIKEFDYTKRSNNTNNKTMLKKKRASGTSYKRDKNFVDATREGYLDACIPYMVPNYKPNKVAHKSIILRNDTLATTFAEVLLRSRSERKCQRLSREKCIKACHFAATESCAKYECSRKWKKAVDRVCKEECRRAYHVKSTSDSSDTSGSY